MMSRAVAVALALLVLILGPRIAIAPAFAQAAPKVGRTPVPVVPKGKGKHCIRPVAYMRRYHMTLLLHQRNISVEQGILGSDISIEKCITCHVVKGADGKPVTYASPQHFCNSCHSYVGVKISCFDCHKSTPDEPIKAASLSPVLNPAFKHDDLAALSNYLQETKP